MKLYRIVIDVERLYGTECGQLVFLVLAPGSGRARQLANKIMRLEADQINAVHVEVKE